jgi:hypothetical protein
VLWFQQIITEKRVKKMKIYTSKYRHHWVSPYTILEKVCFWEKDKDVFYNHENKPDAPYEKWVDRLHVLCVAWRKFLDFVHPPIEYVKIDYWDTWSMDSTLAPIILPMLKQLRDTKHGSCIVDLEDVPEELRGTGHESWDQQMSFDFYHEEEKDVNYEAVHDRWTWVLNEMIFAFEHLIDDSWEDEFRSGVMDHKSVPCAWDENGKATLYRMEEGPNHTYKCDYDAIQKVNKRMENGFKLFGKYYRGLWD